MEQYDPTRRQYVPNTTAAQQPQQTRAPTQSDYSQYGSPTSAERFRQSSYLQQSPASATPAGRVGGDPQQMYGFLPSAQYGSGNTMQPSGIQYGQEMQAPETRRQYAQQYTPYGGNIMYGIPQAQPTQPSQSPYEQASQYRQRAAPSSETAATQFGVPQATQYYLAGQPGATSVVAPEFAAPNIPSQYQQPDPYSQPGSSVSQYAGSMMDPGQSAMYTTYGQQPQYTTQVQPPSSDQGFDRYQSQIRTIFTLVQNESLRDIGGPLLEISQYLLSNVETLGLARDEEALHDDRVRLWDEFNRAWLATLQRQYDLTQRGFQTGNTPSIMNTATLERLSHELVRLCDSIERHGLVDYQMGVAEEDIVDLMIRCQSLLRRVDDDTSPNDSQAQSSVAGAPRGR